MLSNSTTHTAESELVIRRFGKSGTPVLLVHGLGDNGDVFCPSSGSGLAPWLGNAGYRVHVADLRMRSSTDVSVADITQHQLITEDLPALFDGIEQEHPQQRFFIVAHGWGGVLVACALIRQPSWVDRIAGLIQVGARRVCQQTNWQRRLLLDLMWGRVAPFMGRAQQHVALRALGLGRVDISRQLHDDVQAWLNGGQWHDPQDGFDYATALNEISWPDSLYIAGNNDHYMGHPADVKAFARELGAHDAQLILLQKGTGCSRDYGHHDLLTHSQAETDHFPLILSWLTR